MRAPFTTRQRIRPRRKSLWQVPAVAWKAGFLLGLVALGLGVTTLLQRFFTSPIFAVRKIEIAGLERMNESEVGAAAGIVPGVNLFSIDPARVKARLEALPQIKRAELFREWPNRVRVVVEERTPFALALAGGLVWIDEEGAVLEDQPRPVAQPLPLISGFSAEELTPGRRVPSDRLRMAVALLRSIVRTGGRLPSEISEVDVTNPEAPLLYTLDGIAVKLGGEPWEERLGRLEGLLGQLKNQHDRVESLDLRFSDLVVLKPKGGK